MLQRYLHSRQGLSQGESRDEDAGVEGGMAFVADLEMKNELPGIWEDGGERDRLCNSYEGCRKNVLVLHMVIAVAT